MINYYDSHTHLNSPKIFDQWEEYTKQFVSIWGKGLINVGADLIYNQNMLAIATKYKSKFPDLYIWSVIWWHPYECVTGLITIDNTDDMITQLKKWYTDYKDYICAIWEAGIDLHY